MMSLTQCVLLIEHALFIQINHTFMNTWKLVHNDRTYGYYHGEDIYDALANARYLYKWALLSHLKPVSYR